MNRLFLAFAFGVVHAAAIAPVHAQAYPSKPIWLFVSSGLQGDTDTTARITAAVLTENLGQQVIVENRPGA